MPDETTVFSVGTGQDIGYYFLDHDSLLRHRNVLLVKPVADSLNAHRISALDRFVAAGGRLAIIGGDLHPLDWAKYAGASRAAGGQPFPVGRGSLLLAEASTTEEELVAYFGPADPLVPAFAHELPPLAPPTDRFRIEVLDQNIYEPMEMEILPGGDVLFLERRGKMKLYDAARGATKLVRDFDVCTEGNYEDGLHGLALDPDYGRENHFIYLYYTPAPCDSLDQLLSRFEFRNGQLDTASERVVLRVPVQRETCCHSGGSLEFGPNGLLYLSTGDNTSSKESDGYSPLDERPGRAPFDAQKSSGNANDLRGAILRIRVTADGGYEIPAGNLFPPDGSAGKPEIYAMGCRNPFRITIDPWTSYLYWGDVGPDVGEAGRYGPQSYDEWNQARTAGNFGWPYFVGDNFAYPRRNFATDEVGEPYDPSHPVNNSPNNDGPRELPVAQPALIWYPYGLSEEFPQLGAGSRSAMSGPFYDRRKLLPITNLALPEYYDGKWFIYEWARSWIKVVTLDSARQEVVQIEDFLPDFPISKPIDFKFGRDGAIYLLEYGNNYFLNNPDARLVRITYSDRNRPPVATLEVDETAGGTPFQPNFTASGSFDPDPKDSITYTWHLNGKKSGEGPTFSPVIGRKGNHLVRLEVTDVSGATAEARQQVAAGNARPTLALELSGNRSFLFAGNNQLAYRTQVDDYEDRASGNFDASQTLVQAAWLEDAAMIKDLRRGKAQLPAGDLEYVAGAGLIAASDCYTCHQERGENVGPAYLEVAERYDDAPATISRLAAKVIKGGNGVWGERLMSAHPTLSVAEAETMVGYILSLDNGSRLPLNGSLRPGARAGAYVLAASYRDRGGLVGQGLVVLRQPRLEAEEAFDHFYRAEVPGSGQNHAFEVVDFRPGGTARMDAIDLSGVAALRLHLYPHQPGELELRSGSADGPLIASRNLPARPDWDDYTDVDLVIPTAFSAAPPADLYLVWKGEGGVVEDDMGHHRPGNIGWIDYLTFLPQSAK